MPILLVTLVIVASGCRGLGGKGVPEDTDAATPHVADVPQQRAASSPKGDLTSPLPPPTQEAATVTPSLEPSTMPVPGSLAPDISLPDLNGNRVALSDQRGRPVLLNFWTTW